MDFSVGDRVMIVDAFGYEGKFIGATGTITYIEEDAIEKELLYKVLFDDTDLGLFFFAEELNKIN